MGKKKKKTAGTVGLVLVLIVALFVFLYSGYRLLGILTEYRSGEKEYEALQQYVTPKTPGTENGSDTDDPKETGQTADGNIAADAPLTVDFDALRQVNGDIVAWIYTEAVPEISYPVVQGEDNEYYLHHTVEKQKNSSASIFLDYRNSASFTDAMTVIYGHNMKNKSMFGRLKTYKKEEVFEKSPYIWLLTPDKTLKYEIFSVTTVNENDELYALSMTDGEEKKAYMEKMQKKSAVPTTVEYTGDEPILTLSTCTGTHTDRCVVQAVLKEVY